VRACKIAGAAARDLAEMGSNVIGEKSDQSIAGRLHA
jgi:hypothetical protein